MFTTYPVTLSSGRTILQTFRYISEPLESEMKCKQAVNVNWHLIYVHRGEKRTTKRKRKIQQHQTEKHNIQKTVKVKQALQLQILTTTTTVIIGASNCRTVQVIDPNICNLSISGTTVENIDAILENVDCKLNTTDVSKMIFIQTMWQTIKLIIIWLMSMCLTL